MKKTGLFLGFLFISFAGYADGNLELYAGAPLFYAFQGSSGYTANAMVLSASLGVSGAYHFTERIGIGGSVNLIFPLKVDAEAREGSVTETPADYNFIFSMDLFLGPVFTLGRIGRLTLRGAAGVHYFELWSLVDPLGMDAGNFGIGAYISGEYPLSRRVYLLAKVQGSFDFYSVTKTIYLGTSRINSGTLTNWGIIPGFGVGFVY
jgi:hypothetical protein